MKRICWTTWCVAALSWSTVAAQVPVRIVTSATDANLPIWVAQDKGYFEDEDLDVTLTTVADPAAVFEELAKRRQEVAIVPFADVAAFVERTPVAGAPPGTLFARAHAFAALTIGGLVLMADASIADVAGLKGKAIAVDAKGSGQEALLQVALRNAGLASGDYSFVAAGNDPDRLKALLDRRAAAALLEPAHAELAQAAGARRVWALADAGPTQNFVAVFHNFWTDRDAAIGGFAKACITAMNWLLDPGNRAEVTAVFRKRIPGLNESQAVAALQALSKQRDGLAPRCRIERMAADNAAYVQRLAQFPQAPMGNTGYFTTQTIGNAEIVMDQNRRAGIGIGVPLVAVAEGRGSTARAERAVDRALKQATRLDDGTWLLDAMYREFRFQVESQRSWDAMGARLEAWRTARPDSVTAALALANYWIGYAWDARGGAPASQVPEAAWRLFHERLAKARTALLDVDKQGKANPAWYATMLGIEFAEGRPQAERATLFNEAIAKEPRYYATYRAFAWGLTPRWGGDLRSFHEFADAAVARTRDTDGSSLYARLYPLLMQVEHDRDPFGELGIPWPKMRSGFEDLLARYPKATRALHEFALYACMAGDAKAFQALLPKLNERAFPVSGAFTFEVCKAEMLKRA